MRTFFKIVLAGISLFGFSVLMQRLSKARERRRSRQRDTQAKEMQTFWRVNGLTYSNDVTPVMAHRLYELASNPEECCRAFSAFDGENLENDAELRKLLFPKWDMKVEEVLERECDRGEIIDLLCHIRPQSLLYERAVRKLFALDSNFEEAFETMNECSPKYPELHALACDKVKAKVTTPEEREDLDLYLFPSGYRLGGM